MKRFANITSSTFYTKLYLLTFWIRYYKIEKSKQFVCQVKSWGKAIFGIIISKHKDISTDWVVFIRKEKKRRWFIIYVFYAQTDCCSFFSPLKMCFILKFRHPPWLLCVILRCRFILVKNCFFFRSTISTHFLLHSTIFLSPKIFLRKGEIGFCETFIINGRLYSRFHYVIIIQNDPIRKP